MKTFQLFTGILMIISSLLLCNSLNDVDNIEKQNNAISYARDYSGTKSTRNWKDIYWDNISDYRSVDEFNEAMALNRTVSLKYLSLDDNWAWDTDSSRLKFKNMRSELK